jgi:hypothetical protein
MQVTLFSLAFGAMSGSRLTSRWQHDRLRRPSAEKSVSTTAEPGVTAALNPNDRPRNAQRRTNRNK